MDKQERLEKLKAQFGLINVPMLAQQLGVTVDHLRGIQRGRPIGAVRAKKIEELTCGAVKKEVLRPDIWE